MEGQKDAPPGQSATHLWGARKPSQLSSALCAPSSAPSACHIESMFLAQSRLTRVGLLAARELTGPYPLSRHHHGRVRLLQTQVRAVQHRKMLRISAAAYVVVVSYSLRKEMAGEGFGGVALSEALC